MKGAEQEGATHRSKDGQEGKMAAVLAGFRSDPATEEGSEICTGQALHRQGARLLCPWAGNWL